MPQLPVTQQSPSVQWARLISDWSQLARPLAPSAANAQAVRQGSIGHNLVRPQFCSAKLPLQSKPGLQSASVIGPG